MSVESPGVYQFRALHLGRVFWSQGECSLPGCPSAEIVVADVQLTVVKKTAGVEGAAPAGTHLAVWANGVHVASATADGTTLTYTMAVPPGQTYQFRAMHLGLAFWSPQFQCTASPCETIKIEVADTAVTVVRKHGGTEMPVPAGTHLAVWANGVHVGSATADGATLTYAMAVPPGQTYQFRAMHLGLAFWSPLFQQCTALPCETIKIEIADAELMVVRRQGGAEVPVPAGTHLGVWAGGAHVGSATADGTNVTYTMAVPPGQTYQFRAMHLGQAFWSPQFQQCTLLPCPPIKIVIADVSVTVVRHDGGSQTPAPAGTHLAVWADGVHVGSATADGTSSTYTMAVPADQTYQFRAMHLGRAFWTPQFQLCSVLPCLPIPIHLADVLVRVRKQDGTPVLAGTSVSAWSNGNTVQSGVTPDATGAMRIPLPHDGAYRFSALWQGQSVWSSASDTCVLPTCTEVTIIVDTPCLGAPAGAACDDGNACTLGDKCTSAKTCEGAPKSCSDGNSCTVDTCQPSTGVCSNTASTCGVTPQVCTMTDANSGVVAVFGYSTDPSLTSNLEIAHGANNQLSPGTLQGRQPRWFRPGNQSAAFVLPIPQGNPISWTLGGQTVSTSSASSCSGAAVTSANQQFFLSGPTTELNQPNSIPALRTPAAMGTLPGDLDVTHTGNATYSIPLHAPAGRLGIEPNLSLVYNSGSNKNGLLGVGWGISGLPTIHRCAKTIAQDGDAAPIRFTAEDAFCLDGERLVEVAIQDGSASGEPDQIVKEYRTERDSYSRIRSFVSAQGGPKYFTLRAADGRILTFGFREGTDVLARRASFPFPNMDSSTPEEPTYDTEVIYDWPLTKLEDRFGNWMTVSYDTPPPDISDQFAFQRRPLLISYTHHSTRSGLRSVKFVYTDRAAVIASDPALVSFAGGVKHVVNKLLTSVEMSAPDPTNPAVVRSYKLVFTASASTQRALLSSVSECDGSATPVCKPATSFDYTPGSSTFLPVQTGITLSMLSTENYSIYRRSGYARLAIGDVNGDGFDDIVYKKFLGDGGNQRPTVHLSTGSGFAAPFDVVVDSSLVNEGVPELIDVNGDGRAEIGLYYRSSVPLHLAFCTVDDNSEHTCNLSPASEAVEAPQIPSVEKLFTLPIDLTADGLPELIRTRGSLFLDVRMNVNGTLQPYESFAPDQLTDRFPLVGMEAVDIDGDGRQELLFPAQETDAKLAIRGPSPGPPISATSAVEVRGAFSSFPISTLM